MTDRRIVISHLLHSTFRQAKALSTLTLAIAISTAQAQDAGNDESTVIYPASFFEQYTPTSANDMVARIPGVSLNNGNNSNNRGGGGGRGLGTSGDLLINGKRLAGKDNSTSSQLTRISADQVERIEIIRGSSGAMDVRGASQVVNIVLKESTDTASISAEIGVDYHHDDTADPGGSFSYGGQAGNLNYLVNLEADPRYNGFTRTEYNYLPDRSLSEIVRENSYRDQTGLQASMTLGYDFTRDRVQFNALIGEEGHPYVIDRSIQRPPAVTDVFRRESEKTDNDNSNWEIGGNHEHSFLDGSRFQFLFVVNEEVRDSVRERFQVLSGARNKLQYLQSDRTTRERIGQASYSWRLTDSQDMQLGFERAQTILDTRLLVGSGTATGAPSAAYGSLVPVLSSSNPGSTVEEIRYEAFAVHNWTLNPRMSLESTLLYEDSAITQAGAASRERDFQFWRPKLDYRFDMTGSLQLRATAERQVSQLSFESFTATLNYQDNDKDSTAGNPDLTQEIEMRYELGLEYRLPNDGGVLSARAFYRDIDDVIGKINLSRDSTKPKSATGNLGNGKRYGAYLNASARLGFLGMPEAVLTSSLNIFDSYVHDPIVGGDRRFNGRGNASIGFRHDLPSLGVNYGFDLQNDFHGGEKNIDVDTLETSRPGRQLNLFISKVAFQDITFRLEANNVLKSEFCRDRLRFDGLVANGLLEEIEDSCGSGGGQKIAIKIRTTF